MIVTIIRIETELLTVLQLIVFQFSLRSSFRNAERRKIVKVLEEFADLQNFVCHSFFFFFLDESEFPER